MENERMSASEAGLTGRTIEGKEKEEFAVELGEYVAGLEAALADPDLPAEDRAEMEEQLAALKDSQEAVRDGGAVRVEV